VLESGFGLWESILKKEEEIFYHFQSSFHVLWHPSSFFFLKSSLLLYWMNGVYISESIVCSICNECRFRVCGHVRGDSEWVTV